MNADAADPPTVGWSVEKSIEDMDRAGVRTSMASITTPGVWFGEQRRRRRLARECNDYAARLAGPSGPLRPVRFVAPARCRRPACARSNTRFDTLKADGVGLLPAIGDKWLGDPVFAPVMDELNRRKAVVYTHPTDRRLLPQPHRPHRPTTVIEYGTDTTRAIASMLFSRRASSAVPTSSSSSRMRGGTMPFLIERFIAPARRRWWRTPGASSRRRCKLSTTTPPRPRTRSARRPGADRVDSQIVFGTDFPFRTAADHEQGLINFGFNDSELSAINRDNALQFLPRFKA